ncbi:quinone-dependent dihydroorotate dehydrogenase [Membranicola marinus]|uniref:Dihydroorotate dehydrogenase (quinone) n=1 Tax=Membranihabitans marinus TaxID=1227546 RepID=A0A953HQP0_9BACT|nr:quinone-dependent dihydroorotate dehydrogenase [Membranihabitans marinus]MBY5956635.1 quinone-dependent dihydroorotate dehydrogenase [Membranihabitans marinus]
MSMYESILKPYMFRRDAEEAHTKTMALLRLAASVPGGKAMLKRRFVLTDARLEKTLMGISFKNPVGLAAGFDKDGKYIDLLPLLGFGFAEIGTVTPRAQVGNPRPRLFRLEKDEALINRMGFNNEGVMALKRRLEQRKDSRFVLGANIGKNKDTANDDAFKDYVICFRELRSLVNFFVINVSSPNTPGLRELQNKESLRRILGSVQSINESRIPVLLKIAPDMNLHLLDDIMEVLGETQMDGIVCHNTTIRRAPLKTSAADIEQLGAGGLSGRPLDAMFQNLLYEVDQRLPRGAVRIGSGGVHDAETALRKLKTGADLVEVYTGLIYQGPGFVRQILSRLLSENT